MHHLHTLVGEVLLERGEGLTEAAVVDAEATPQSGAADGVAELGEGARDPAQLLRGSRRGTYAGLAVQRGSFDSGPRNHCDCLSRYTFGPRNRGPPIARIGHHLSACVRVTLCVVAEPSRCAIAGCVCIAKRFQGNRSTAGWRLHWSAG